MEERAMKGLGAMTGLAVVSNAEGKCAQAEELDSETLGIRRRITLTGHANGLWDSIVQGASQ